MAGRKKHVWEETGNTGTGQTDDNLGIHPDLISHTASFHFVDKILGEMKQSLSNSTIFCKCVI